MLSPKWAIRANRKYFQRMFSVRMASGLVNSNYLFSLLLHLIVTLFALPHA